MLALAGCGHLSSHTALNSPPHEQRLAVSEDGVDVIRDALDGRLDRNWSCGSLRAAVGRLPVDERYSTIPLMIMRVADRTCDEALTRVRRESMRARVQLLLGQPDRAPRCWLYRWPPETSSPVGGARVCFDGGRVTLIQIAQHL